MDFFSLPFFSPQIDFDASAAEDRCVIKEHVDADLDSLRNTYMNLENILVCSLFFFFLVFLCVSSVRGFSGGIFFSFSF
jgi:hypothetical protein